MKILHEVAGSQPPILFIGPELVKRYVESVPSRRDILLRVAVRIGMPKAEFLKLPEDDLPATASAVKAYLEGLDTPLSEIMNEDELFECRTADPFKVLCASEMKWVPIPDSKLALYTELGHLISLRDVVPAVFTTCTGDFLPKKVFPDFKSTTSIADIFPSPNDGIGELFLITGCATDPDSLILTTEDVAKRHASSGLLTARLVSLMKEYPLVFIGYEKKDPVIKIIVENIARVIGPRETAEKVLVVDTEFVMQCDDIRSSMYVDTAVGEIRIRVSSSSNWSELYGNILKMKPSIKPLELKRIREMVNAVTITNNTSDKPFEFRSPEAVAEDRSPDTIMTLRTDRTGVIWKRVDDPDESG